MQDLIHTVSRTPLEPRPGPAFPQRPFEDEFITVICGSMLCRLHVWTEEEWADLQGQNAPPVSCMHPAWAGSLLFRCAHKIETRLSVILSGTMTITSAEAADAGGWIEAAFVEREVGVEVEGAARRFIGHRDAGARTSLRNRIGSVSHR